jgi:Trk K+ transport system NAD-binding subunit
MPVARLLRINALEGKKALIIGASMFGRALAQAIKENGRPVALVDTNLTMIERAQREGFEAIHGNALREETLEQTDMDEVETLVAVTTNSEVNVLVAQLASGNFGIRLAYPSLKSPEKGAGAKLLAQTGGRLAFGKPVDILTWEYTSGKAYKIEWDAPSGWRNKVMSEIEIPDPLIPILRIRDKSTEIVHADQRWQQGDKIVFLSSLNPEKTGELLKSLGK